MTTFKKWFDTYRVVTSGVVYMGNDQSCIMVGIGNIKIEFFDDSTESYMESGMYLTQKKFNFTWDVGCEKL